MSVAVRKTVLEHEHGMCLSSPFAQQLCPGLERAARRNPGSARFRHDTTEALKLTLNRSVNPTKSQFLDPISDEAR